MEKVLSYDRGIVAQETGYWCGPASTQIVLNSRGVKVAESVLAREIGTHTGGTNHIGLIEAVLDTRVPAAKYAVVQMPNDPPTAGQVAALWEHLTRSINAGWGVVANIVSPPSNRPRAVAPSTVSLAYPARDDIYHYVALMGYSDEGGVRRVWWTDPGFAPFGCWMSLAQTASLIPPKGYCWASASPVVSTTVPVSSGLTAAVLAQAMGNVAGVDYAQLLPGYVGAMKAANINTPLRAAHFAAQIGHESGGLRWMEEIADGSAYEWRADLGNTQPGDGKRYKGSGPIQLTGRHNFTAFSAWAFSKGYAPTKTHYVDRPELVRTDPAVGFLAASWYWTVARPQLNSLADADDVVGVTRAINGGTNGLDDRRTRLARCKALGAALLPANDEEDFMSALTDAEQKELLAKTRVIHDQLGPNLWGPDSSLGETGDGKELTLRDGLARLVRVVDAIAGKLGL